MRALIKKENKPECMEVGQVEKPACPDGHVLIRVLAGGGCAERISISARANGSAARFPW